MNPPFTIITGKSTERPIPSNLNAGKLFIPYDVAPYANGLKKPEVWLSDGRSWTLVLEQLTAENVYYDYNVSPLNFTNVEDALNWIMANWGGAGVQSVTGLNTDNTDVFNPIIEISVDGVTITGDGTPGNPLVGASGTPSLTQYEVGVGDASNLLSGSSNLTFNDLLFKIIANIGTSSGWGVIQQLIQSSSSEAGLSLENTGTGGKQWNIISTSNGSGIGGGMLSIGNATDGQNYINLDSTGIITFGLGSNAWFTIDNNTNIVKFYSNDPYFELDGGNRRFRMGDYTFDWYGTYIDINDDVSERTIRLYAANGVYVNNLAGGGTQMVTVDNTGLLVAASLPVSGGYTIVSLVFADSPYTIVPVTGSYIYQVDCTGGNVVINFPTAVGTTATYGIKKIDSSANTITLTPNGAETLDGSSTQTIRFQNSEYDVYSNNVNLFLK